METTTIGDHKVVYHRKNTPKFVHRLTDRACQLLSQGTSLKEISEILRQHLKDIEYKGSIYISYMAVSDWNKTDSLFIWNSSGDYTLVSIRSKKEDQA
jgi:hypothetical protein